MKPAGSLAFLLFWLAPAAGFGVIGGVASAADEEQPVDLVVEAGRPLRVALDERIKLKRVGQPITGTLVEPVFAYDRSVIPAGTKVLGHLERLEKVSKGTRLRAMLRGDFTPLRNAVLQFDTLVMEDKEIPITTRVGAGTEKVSLEVAGSRNKSLAARARQEIAQKVRQTLAPFKEPGKMERLKEFLVSRLPYHPQYLHRGTIYTAELLAPLSFGPAPPTERAPDGTPAPPETVLNARLVTSLDSAKTPRGTVIRAVLTQPVFSSDQRLIFPEGTELQGEVTFAKGARRFHRNGQLRFLFESVQLKDESPEKMLASLYSVELGREDRVAIDEEGGTSVTNSKARFIPPALALLATRASFGHERDSDEIESGREGGGGSLIGRGVGGFFGAGLLGVALSQTSRPVAGVLGFVGFAEGAFGAIFGRGQDVVIPVHTPIQLQLAPGSPAP